MLIETQAVGPIFKNGFIVACDRTSEAVFIDPGDEVASLLAFAERRKLSIRYILLTHAHIDHVTGVPEAKRALKVPIYLHRDDLFLYEGAVEQARMFGLRMEPPPPIDHFYEKDEVIRFGDLEARPHHTPGHCPGGVCLEIRQAGSARGPREESESAPAAQGNARSSARASGGGAPRALENAGTDLFVGDTLFAGSIGRTDLVGGDYGTLMASIRNVLFAFGDDARVYPGHGERTTIGRERRTNPFLT